MSRARARAHCAFARHVCDRVPRGRARSHTINIHGRECKRAQRACAQHRWPEFLNRVCFVFCVLLHRAAAHAATAATASATNDDYYC